jgi:hypothetical protein
MKLPGPDFWPAGVNGVNLHLSLPAVRTRPVGVDSPLVETFYKGFIHIYIYVYMYIYICIDIDI